MIEDLIRRARRRFLLNETLAQSAFAVAVVVAGFVLMLIFGTRYLEWWTLGAFAAAGVGVGVWRVAQRTPDAYSTAVHVDGNAGLHDALSTALHFRHGLAGTAEFREAQRQQAEKAAGEVQLEVAVPFVVPRSLYAMAALCVLASALVALRYGVGHGLNLRAPLTQVLFEDEAIHDAKKAKALNSKSPKWMQEAESLLSKLGMSPTPEQPAPGEEDALDKAIEQALQNPGDSTGKSDKGAGANKAGQSKAGDPSKDAAPGDPIDNGEQQAGNDQNGQDSPNQKSADASAKTPSSQGGNRRDKESLLSRLKDAVSNMLSKSDNNQDSSAQKNQQQANNEPPKSGQGQAGKGQQEKGESQSDAEGQPDADTQGGQQAQGKLNSASNKTPAQGGSGIGNQDGSKEIKAAEQLKAMGKISEIIGQRAATVSGETTVEVQSGAQKLHTDYSTTSAAHAETDGDVTRDEIPLALQSYVQQYFAQVRKSDAKAKAATKE
jgi:hypothetical protein